MKRARRGRSAAAGAEGDGEGEGASEEPDAAAPTPVPAPPAPAVAASPRGAPRLRFSLRAARAAGPPLDGAAALASPLPRHAGSAAAAATAAAAAVAAPRDGGAASPRGPEVKPDDSPPPREGAVDMEGVEAQPGVDVAPKRRRPPRGVARAAPVPVGGGVDIKPEPPEEGAAAAAASAAAAAAAASLAASVAAAGVVVPLAAAPPAPPLSPPGPVMCTICLDDGHAAARAGLDACVHVFCLTCIRRWLALDARCPICRAPALAVHVLAPIGGAVTERIPVASLAAEREAGGEEEEEEFDPMGHVICFLCHRGDHEVRPLGHRSL